MQPDNLLQILGALIRYPDGLPQLISSGAVQNIQLRQVIEPIDLSSLAGHELHHIRAAPPRELLLT